MLTIQEEFKKQLIYFRQTVKDLVLKKFEKDQEVSPIVFGLVKKEDGYGIAIIDGLAPFFQPGSKAFLPAVLDKMNEEVKPLCIAFVSEAHMLKVKKEDAKDIIDENGMLKSKLPFSDRADSEEIIFINFETHNMKCETVWNIDRTKFDPILKLNMDTDFSQKNTEIGGTLDNLLKRNYSEMARDIEKTFKDNLN